MANQKPSIFPIPEGSCKVRTPNQTVFVNNDGTLEESLVNARYVDGLVRYRAYGGIKTPGDGAPTSNVKTDHNDY